MTGKPTTRFGAALATAILAGYSAFAGEEAMSKEIIAAKVRNQGYACGSPKGVERDSEKTLPGEIGWMLECDNARYRVMLVPHKSARIERVEQGSH